MMRSHSCPKCSSSMAEGFVIDSADGVHAVAKWIAGAPIKGFFGVKTRRKNKLEIQTFRCGRCGFLESYARD